MAGNRGHWLRRVPLNTGSSVHQASGTFLQGVNEVVNNLNVEIAKIEGRTLDGMVESVSHVYAQTEEGSPVTPVDTGALRSSWFTVSNRGVEKGGKLKFSGQYSKKSGKKKRSEMIKVESKATITEAKTFVSGSNLVVIAGYSVPYAAFVHENIAGGYPIKKWTRPGSGSKWLQKAFNSSKGEILKIIKNRAQIKG